MPATETWAGGKLVSGWEVVRVGGVPTYREYDANRTITLTRAATADEVAMVVAVEREDAQNVASGRVRVMHDTLQQWATDARAVTVTPGNAVATLQTVVNRFGTMCDRLADLLKHLDLDR